MQDYPREAASSKDNHLTVVLSTRDGDAAIVGDTASASKVRDAVRRAQEHDGIRLASSSAAA
jgi:hypothetical protein